MLSFSFPDISFSLQIQSPFPLIKFFIYLSLIHVFASCLSHIHLLSVSCSWRNPSWNPLTKSNLDLFYGSHIRIFVILGIPFAYSCVGSLVAWFFWFITLPWWSLQELSSSNFLRKVMGGRLFLRSCMSEKSITLHWLPVEFLVGNNFSSEFWWHCSITF